MSTNVFLTLLPCKQLCLGDFIPPQTLIDNFEIRETTLVIAKLP